MDVFGRPEPAANGPDDWSVPELYTAGLPGDGRLPGLTATGPAGYWSAPTYVRTAAAPPRHAAAHRVPDAAPRRADSHRAVLANSRTLAVASLASRVTGFLRSVALGALLGVAATSIADPYNGANSFPNIVFELLLGGVLSSVVIPLLVGAQEHDRDGGEAFTQRLLSIATAALAVATVLAVVAAPVIAWIFVSDPDKRALTSTFAALLLPQIFFYGLGAMFAAVLNTRGVYAPPAWAPVVNNVIVLLTLGLFVIVSPDTGAPTVDSVSTTQILVLGIGTTVGIVAQAFCLLPFLRQVGFRWRWRFTGSATDAARMREFRRLAAWMLGYVVAGQLGLAVITRIAFTHNGLSTFTYAALLFQVPYGIVGVSVLTALMPRMSRAAAQRDADELISDIRLGARLSIVGLVPATAGLMALGPFLTSVIFLGRTSVPEARLIGSVLALAAIGLLPYALVMLQLRAFYVMRDARTPALVNGCMALVEIAFVVPASILLDGDRVIEALGLGTAVSYVIGAVLGHRLLRGRIGLLGFAPVGRLLARVALVSATAGAGAYLVGSAVNRALDGGRAGALGALVAGAGTGLVLLLIGARLLRISELRSLTSLIR